jgi:hypothetical protein
MKMRVAGLGLALTLAACGSTPAQLATATTDTAAAVAAKGTDPMADLQAAADLYGIGKGIAQVAETADPSITPTVTAATTTGDAALAKAQTAVTDASAAAALVATLTAQAQALTLAGAPVITVVPNQAPTY